ncbi:MAG: hypothetical protein ABIV26_09215, partial [Candidatus Limnocylindrales bacterium]
MSARRVSRGHGLALTVVAFLAACQPSLTESPSATGAATGPATPAATEGLSPAATDLLPPSGRLAFDRYEGSTEGRWLGLFVLDTANAVRQVPLALEGEGAGPAWSPDGARLLVNLSLASGQGRPGIIDPTGASYLAVNVAGLDGEIACTDWSPDGALVICSVSSHDPTRDGIYLVHADGTEPVRLTTSPFHDTVGATGECGGGDNRPVFSPDGTEFAFIRQRCGAGPDPSSDETGAIEIANIDGSGLRELVPQGGVFTHLGGRLAWAPSGGLIAYADRDRGLATVDTHGGGVRLIDLGSNPRVHGVLGAAWAPDAGWLAVSTFAENGVGNLFIARPDGTDITEVPDTTGAVSVDWGP